MGTIEDNKVYYDNYDWQRTGEHWASRWGGTDVQWYGTILPRIHIFLPVTTILEIGAGHGRLSQFLVSHCDRLILVDMTECCAEACRKRFAGIPKVECVHNDGLSLAGVERASVDFVFSFFSLVHADDMTMKSYVFEIAEKLSPTGVAFIHHSNAATCRDVAPGDEAVLNNYRDASVSSEIVAEFARKAGLVCCSQELFGWDSDQLLTDCFSVLTRQRSRFAWRNTVICNRDFPFEAEKLGQLSKAYGDSGYLL
jgi:SAM-dependent methyltransferase